MEKQIMEQHLQETAGDLEYAERELSRRGSPIGTPPREDSDDGSPRQQTPTLRQQHADDPEHLKEENERIMEVLPATVCCPPVPACLLSVLRNLHDAFSKLAGDQLVHLVTHLHRLHLVTL